MSRLGSLLHQWFINIWHCCLHLWSQPAPTSLLEAEVDSPVSPVLLTPSPEDGSPIAPALLHDLRVGDLPVLDIQFHSPGSPRRPDWAVIELDQAFVFELLSVRDPAGLHSLFPRWLQHLVNNPDIQQLHPDWTPEARLTRALRAGVSALRVARGLFPKQAASPSLPFNNQIYVVVRSRQFPLGWFTWSYDLYARQILPDGEFEEGSISHSFPSATEAEVFLRGCEFTRWPLEMALSH